MVRKTRADRISPELLSRDFLWYPSFLIYMSLDAEVTNGMVQMETDDAETRTPASYKRVMQY